VLKKIQGAANGLVPRKVPQTF
jgi:hypothetical protein